MRSILNAWSEIASPGPMGKYSHLGAGTGRFTIAASKALLLLSLLLLATASCSPEMRDWERKQEKPEGLLDMDQMVAVLVDVHLAEGDAQDKSLHIDKQKELLKRHYERICDLHGISVDQLRSSYDYYVAKPITMTRIYEQVIEELNRLEGELSSAGAAE